MARSCPARTKSLFVEEDQIDIWGADEMYETTECGGQSSRKRGEVKSRYLGHQLEPGFAGSGLEEQLVKRIMS